jgi:hypothetical protein
MGLLSSCELLAVASGLLVSLRTWLLEAKTTGQALAGTTHIQRGSFSRVVRACYLPFFSGLACLLFLSTDLCWLSCFCFALLCCFAWLGRDTLFEHLCFDCCCVD